MANSVSDVLAASEAKKSPFSSLLEGVAQGFGEGFKGAPARMKTMLEAQQMQMDQQHQMEVEQEIKNQIAQQTEAATRQRFGAASGQRVSAMPTVKYKVKYGQDAHGRYTRSIEQADPAGTGANPVYSPEQVKAIQESRSAQDPTKLSAVFPGGVPKDALDKVMAGERIDNMESERSQRSGERLATARTNIVNQFEAHPVVKKARQSIGAVDTIRGLIDSDSPIAAAAIPTYMARASGEVGNLSEADKAPFGGSRAMLDRFEAALKEKVNGKLTDANKQYLQDITNVMANSSNSVLDNMARERSKQSIKAGGYFKKPEDVFAALRPDSKWAPDNAGGDVEAKRAALRAKLGLGGN